jgi:hypothetical protein
MFHSSFSLIFSFQIPHFTLCFTRWSNCQFLENRYTPKADVDLDQYNLWFPSFWWSFGEVFWFDPIKVNHNEFNMLPNFIEEQLEINIETWASEFNPLATYFKSAKEANGQRFPTTPRTYTIVSHWIYSFLQELYHWMNGPPDAIWKHEFAADSML